MNTEKQTEFDVAVVGAGPGGVTTAFYSKRLGRSVVLLDKEEFPRRKICGDAITLRARKHLSRMGALQTLEEAGLCNPAALGGLVSPGGIAYYGDSASQVGEPLVMAIRREDMDHHAVLAAEREGVMFRPGFHVQKAELDRESGVWTVTARGGATVTAKILVAADGASSHLARSLGLLSDPPEALCSSVYIQNGTHSFEHDGIVFYPEYLLPGYAALFKESGGDLVFCCYIIPGGKAKTTDLKELHHRILTEYEPVAGALGPGAQIEEMKSAPLRLGGIERSFDDHLLVVGDAAGQIDPLTGEGIQYAMDAGEIAARTIQEAFETSDFTREVMRRYHLGWMSLFGMDFRWSARMASFSGKNPLFLDAFASISKKKGDSFMSEWGKIMTGEKPKRHFFLPALSLPLAAEAMRLWLERKKEKK
jgi:geranylgeranyl reductase family protein